MTTAFVSLSDLRAGASNKNGNPFGNGTFFQGGTFSAVIRGQNLSGIMLVSAPPGASGGSNSTSTNTSSTNGSGGVATIIFQGNAFQANANANVDPSSSQIGGNFYGGITLSGSGSNSILASTTNPLTPVVSNTNIYTTNWDYSINTYTNTKPMVTVTTNSNPVVTYSTNNAPVVTVTTNSNPVYTSFTNTLIVPPQTNYFTNYTYTYSYSTNSNPVITTITNYTYTYSYSTNFSPEVTVITNSNAIVTYTNVTITNYLNLQQVATTTFNDAVQVVGAYAGPLNNQYPNQTFLGNGGVTQKKISFGTNGIPTVELQNYPIYVQGILISSAMQTFPTTYSSNSVPFARTIYTMTNLTTSSR
jgi:hypothetical protein